MESNRILAATLEHEWSDVLFPGRTRPLEHFIEHPLGTEALFYPSPFFRRTAGALSAWLAARQLPCETVYEVGGGAGRFAYEFLEAHPETQRYVMSDPSQDKIRHARWIFGEDVHINSLPVNVSQTRWERLPVERPQLGDRPWLSKLEVAARNVESSEWIRESADVVVCLNVIDHVENPPRFLFHLRRLLKPGGVLLLASPLDWHSDFTPTGYWQDRLEDFLEGRWEVLERDELPFYYRTRPRRMILFASEVLLIRRATEE